MWNHLRPHLEKPWSGGGNAPPGGIGTAAIPRPQAPNSPPPQALPNQNNALANQNPPSPAPNSPPQPHTAPHHAAHDPLKPNAQIAQIVVQRAKMLTPQEQQDFFNGTTVPALLVLKKILVEISPAVDQAIAKKQGGQGGGAPAMPAPPPGAGPPQGAPPQPQPPPPQPPLQLPQRSGLRSV